MRPNKLRNAGFTLAEVLLSLIITAAIITVAFSSLRTIGRLWDKISHRDTELTLRTATLQLLRSELSQLAPLSVKRPGKSIAAFHGTPSSIRFIAPIPGLRESADLSIIEFALERTTVSSDAYLQFRHCPLPHKLPINFSNAHCAWQERRLAPLGERVMFSFYGAPNELTPADWSGNWAEPDRFPNVIALRFSVDNVFRELLFPIHGNPAASRTAITIPGVLDSDKGGNSHAAD